jgi:hypothetical protein
MPDLAIRRAGVIALLAFTQACAPAEPTPPPEVYEIRGIVRQLPSARAPGSTLQIRHEAIPDFVKADGEVVGMQSMTMPFAVADETLLDGIHVGDKVAATIEVRWQGGDPLRITALEKLPPETVLGFERPAEEKAEPADGVSDPP